MTREEAQASIRARNPFSGTAHFWAYGQWAYFNSTPEEFTAVYGKSREDWEREYSTRTKLKDDPADTPAVSR